MRYSAFVIFHFYLRTAQTSGRLRGVNIALDKSAHLKAVFNNTK